MQTQKPTDVALRPIAHRTTDRTRIYVHPRSDHVCLLAVATVGGLSRRINLTLTPVEAATLAAWLVTAADSWPPTPIED